METSLWIFNTVFTAAGGQRLLSSLPVNKKAKPLSPTSSTNIHSCWEGSPMWRVHLWPRQQQSSAFLLSCCHSCKSQPRTISVASFQMGHFHEFIDYTYTASCVKMLRSSLCKETSLMRTHFKILPLQKKKNAYGHHNIHQRLSLFI